MSSPRRALVVGAAIVAGGCVLAARRTSPPEAAGRWELPGGKVEPGEAPAVALMREVAEELGCRVELVGWLTPSVPIGRELELRVAVARLVGGLPSPVEHDSVRWLAADALHDVDWLDADRPFLPEVQTWLAQHPPGARGVFFGEDQAHAAVATLRADGFTAEVVRERLAGEDDDEGHPWAVLSASKATVTPPRSAMFSPSPSRPLTIRPGRAS